MKTNIARRVWLRTIAAIMLFSFGTGGVAAADEPSWLCIPDAATGFSFVNGKWQISNFKVNDKKYILSSSTDFRGPGYKWKEFGKNDIGNYCEGDVTTGFACGRIEKIVFDIPSLRYMLTYSQGYVDGKDNNANTPHIEIGRCSRL